jgi:hypothetical protein
MAKKLDNTPVRKNIDLPKWVVDEFKEMAKESRNTVKPYLELTLINIAESHKNTKQIIGHFRSPENKQW